MEEIQVVYEFLSENSIQLVIVALFIWEYLRDKQKKEPLLENIEKQLKVNNDRYNNAEEVAKITSEHNKKLVELIEITNDTVKNNNITAEHMVQAVDGLNTSLERQGIILEKFMEHSNEQAIIINNLAQREQDQKKQLDCTQELMQKIYTNMQRTSDDIKDVKSTLYTRK